MKSLTAEEFRNALSLIWGIEYALRAIGFDNKTAELLAETVAVSS